MKSSLRERGYPVPFFYTMEVKMFRNRLLKILALLMVLNILIIPLTSFSPSQQNKYTVHASEGIVDIRFFNAVMSMLGITAAGLAFMSESFVIPEIDMIQLKEQFEQTLELDAAKKSAWIEAQTDYLAGGVAKTMGAVELAKIGVNDIYQDFKNYLSEIYYPQNTLTEGFTSGLIPSTFAYQATVGKYEIYTNKTLDINPQGWIWNEWNIQDNVDVNQWMYNQNTLQLPYIAYTIDGYFFMYDKSTGKLVNGDYCNLIQFQRSGTEFKILRAPSSYFIRNGISSLPELSILMSYLGVSLIYENSVISNPVGNINYQDSDNIVSVDEEYIHIFPTIPWIDSTVPIGTIVTPEISAPYSGSVPIDVPITAPIDPPIEEPVDPPADVTLLGTVSAILAGITPISAILDNILESELDIADVIEVGITGVIDGIGDIAGTLTGGITSSLTDIQTKIDSLFDPPTDTINFDKIKNLNSVMFTKFPFSIPFDFIAMITAFNGDPVAPVLKIPFDLTSLGGENTELEFDLSRFDYIASIARQINFIGFAFFMLFNTRKFIWK